jgi:predicted site-specific integrase-resolvase
MILGKVSQPKQKSDLIKRFQQLRNVQFTVIEDVTKSQMGSVKTEIEKYIGSKEATIIVLKERL